MNKIGFLTLLLVATLLLMLAFPVLAAGPKAPAPPVVAVPMVVMVPTAPPPHPHVKEALEAMRAAKAHMEQAKPEFEGHRAKAIEHLDQAIHEAEICMSMP